MSCGGGGANLRGEIVVLLLLARAQRVPPLVEDIADGAVVLVRVLLVHERAVSLAEDHEGVHRTPDVLLRLLQRRHLNDFDWSVVTSRFEQQCFRFQITTYTVAVRKSGRTVMNSTAKLRISHNYANSTSVTVFPAIMLDVLQETCYFPPQQYFYKLTPNMAISG